MTPQELVALTGAPVIDVVQAPSEASAEGQA
jgi:hypothetical protein